MAITLRLPAISGRLCSMLLSASLTALGALPAAQAQAQPAPKSYVLGEIVVGDVVFTCGDEVQVKNFVNEFNQMESGKLDDKRKLIRRYRVMGLCDYYESINHKPLHTVHIAPFYYKSKDGKMSESNMVSVIASQILDEKKRFIGLVDNLIVFAQVPPMQEGRKSIVSGKATEARCNHVTVDIALADVCRP